MAKGKAKSAKVVKTKGRQLDRKAAGATKPKKSAGTEKAPQSTDIRRVYLKSLLGDYLGAGPAATASKPKKK